MQQMVNVWGPGLNHHDNLGLYDLGEINEHDIPFSLSDLIMRGSILSCFSQCRKVKVKSLSLVRLLATPWIAAHQAPPSQGFSRQEYWSGVPLLSLREV